MAQLHPFRALRPPPERSSQIASVPYDVVNREEARTLAEGNPRSLLRITRAEIALDEGLNPYAPAVYEAARRGLTALVKDGSLVRDAEPNLYIYTLKMKDHVQTGVAGVFSLDEYERGSIKKHERTRQDKEDDRTRHILAVGAQTGPVLLAYQGVGELDRRVEAGRKEAPLYDFVAPDGISHTVWRARNCAELIQGFASVRALYIADGHHRAASACRAREERRRATPGHTGNEDYNFFLAVAFPAEQLQILPYHRVLKDLHGHSPESLLQLIRDAGFRVTPATASSAAAGEFSLFLSGRWYGLAPISDPPGAKGASGTAAVDRLDVSVLQSRILAPLFGIQDPRTDKRIDFVGGIRGPGELERLVRSGQAMAAFALHATTIQELMVISDSGESMPPKSTWFEPKLRDGLLIHVI